MLRASLALSLALWLAPSTAFVRPLPLLVPGTARYSTPRTVVARAAPLRASGAWFFDAERSKAVAERAGADGASRVGAVGLSVIGGCLLVSSVFRTVFTTLVPLGSALLWQRLALALGLTLLMWAVVLGPPILGLCLMRRGLWRPWPSAPVQRCVQERKTAHHKGLLRPLPPAPPPAQHHTPATAQASSCTGPMTGHPMTGRHFPVSLGAACC